MKYDLHVHSYHSACAILKPKTILRIAKKIELDGIAVADHNSLKGGIETKKLNKDKDFEVIPSIEVDTDRGHVLGLYVNEGIRSKKFFDVTDQIKAQGGIAIIAHPFRILPTLRSKLKGIDIKKYLDAVECYNARTSNYSNKQAQKIANRFQLAKTGGSDAHFPFEIGRSTTSFEGDLRTAIKKRKTTASGSNITGVVGSALSFLHKRLIKGV
jgi:hypothetical protein